MAEEHLTLEVLIAILVLVLYTIAAPIFEKYHFHYINESGLVMLLGILITLLIKIISPSSDFTKSLGFDDEIFFTFILPLIIFGAGYNLRRRSFFKYFMYIFLLGVVGTLIAFGVVAPVTYFVNSFKIFYLSFSQYDYETLLKMNGETNETIASIMANITKNTLTAKHFEFLFGGKCLYFMFFSLQRSFFVQICLLFILSHPSLWFRDAFETVTHGL